MTSKKGSLRSKSAEKRPPAERLQNSSLFNVFIGWSGNRSRQVAGALHEWLPKVIQSSRPWMSDIDIDKGKRWEEDLAIQLSANQFGILCLTPDNLDSRWMLFEAGAMSRDFENRVSAYLFSLSPEDVKPPLTQFQNTIAEKDDTKKLVISINRAIGSPIDDAALEESYDVWWPKLDAKLRSIPPAAPPPKRETDEILGEILDHVREIRRTSTAPSVIGPGRSVSIRLSDILGPGASGGIGGAFPPGAENRGTVFGGLSESPLMNVLRQAAANTPTPPENPQKKK